MKRQIVTVRSLTQAISRWLTGRDVGYLADLVNEAGVECSRTADETQDPVVQDRATKDQVLLMAMAHDINDIQINQLYRLEE